ncbi:hypothetical protein TNCV_228331 [Trichonephila clavipes]|nr:hypothetical protein TNCV_228331 [Trichonephila clavipes]
MAKCFLLRLSGFGVLFPSQILAVLTVKILAKSSSREIGGSPPLFRVHSYTKIGTCESPPRLEAYSPRCITGNRQKDWRPSHLDASLGILKQIQETGTTDNEVCTSN